MSITTPLAMGFFFFLLAVTFNYPAVVDETPAEVLQAVGDASDAIPVLWLGVTLSAVLMMALVTALHGLLLEDSGARERQRLPYLPIVTGFGVFAALFMILDLVQWVWLYPMLGDRFLAGTVDPEVLESQFQVFHEYLGIGIGIYLATLFNAVWAAGLGWVMLGSSTFPRRVGWLGVAGGLLFAVSIAPGAGFEIYSVFNSIGFVVWAVWLLGTGVVLIREHHPAPQTG